MKKIIFLVALIGLLGVGDVFAKGFAEGELAAKVESSVDGSAGVDADIDSFPFVGRLLVSGEVPELELRVDELSGRSLELTEVFVRLEGVVLDKSNLTKGEAEVKSIDRGHVEMTITASALDAIVPDEVELALDDGRLSAEVRGRSVDIELTVSERGELVLRIPPFPSVTIALPGSTLFPCRPDAELTGDEVHLTCSFDEVPPALLRVANEVS